MMRMKQCRAEPPARRSAAPSAARARRPTERSCLVRYARARQVAVHVMLSVSWLAAVLQRVDESRNKRQLELQVRSPLHLTCISPASHLYLACISPVCHLELQRTEAMLQQLNEQLVERLDVNGTGVDKLQFVVRRRSRSHGAHRSPRMPCTIQHYCNQHVINLQSVLSARRGTDISTAPCVCAVQVRMLLVLGVQLRASSEPITLWTDCMLITCSSCSGCSSEPRTVHKSHSVHRSHSVPRAPLKLLHGVCACVRGVQVQLCGKDLDFDEDVQPLIDRFEGMCMACSNVHPMHVCTCASR